MNRRNARVHGIAQLIVDSMIRQAMTTPPGKRIVQALLQTGASPSVLDDYARDVSGQVSPVIEEMLECLEQDALGWDEVPSWKCPECGDEVPVGSSVCGCPEVKS